MNERSSSDTRRKRGCFPSFVRSFVRPFDEIVLRKANSMGKTSLVSARLPGRLCLQPMRCPAPLVWKGMRSRARSLVFSFVRNDLSRDPSFFKGFAFFVFRSSPSVPPSFRCRFYRTNRRRGKGHIGLRGRFFFFARTVTRTAQTSSSDESCPTQPATLPKRNLSGCSRDSGVQSIIANFGLGNKTKNDFVFRPDLQVFPLRLSINVSATGKHGNLDD